MGVGDYVFTTCMHIPVVGSFPATNIFPFKLQREKKLQLSVGEYPNSRAVSRIFVKTWPTQFESVDMQQIIQTISKSGRESTRISVPSGQTARPQAFDGVFTRSSNRSNFLSALFASSPRCKSFRYVLKSADSSTTAFKCTSVMRILPSSSFSASYSASAAAVCSAISRRRMSAQLNCLDSRASYHCESHAHSTGRLSSPFPGYTPWRRC